MEKLIFSVIYKNTPIMNVEGLKLPFSIGSGDFANLKIKDEANLNLHIKILKEGNNIVVRDMNASHSINLNSQPLNEFVVMDMEAFTVNEILYCEIGFVIEDEVEEEKTKVAELTQEFELQNIDEATQIYELTEEEKTSIMQRVTSSKNVTPEKTQVDVFDKTQVDVTQVDHSGMISARGKSSIVSFKQSPLLKPYKPNPKLAKRRKALEANLYWKGKLLQSKQLERNDKLIVGPSEQAGISVPQLSRFREIAQLLNSGLKVNVPSEMECKILRANQSWGEVEYQSVYNKGLFSLLDDEFFVIKIDEFSFLYLRSIPTTHSLSDKDPYDKDLVIWEVFLSSGFVHLLILLLAIYFAPVPDYIPKLDKVPKRFAKLLVKKTPPPPKPKPEPPKKQPEPPKPEIKKPVKKKLELVKPKPRKKVVRKPKKVVVKKVEKMKKLNKYPLKLKSRTVKPTKVQKVAKDSSKVENKNVKAMGALGALLATPTPNTEVASVNIDKNAGGKPQKSNTNSIMSNLKTSNGKLAASGTNRVATKGSGVGDGSSYGVQGLGGSAGAGEVKGTLGRPDVAAFAKNEGLTRKQVMAVVNKHIAQIQRCYEKALISSADLAGRVEYEWTITASGKVSRASVKKSQLKGDGSKLNSCVINVIQSMKFPKAKNGETTNPNIGFPFGRY
jgi:outer membrane biosynthesis protein TonB